MNDYLPFLVIGVTVGSVYGIAAMGLVLTYKTSGVLNVGHGAIAAMAAVCFHQLRQEHGMPWPAAAVISVLGFGIVAGLLMEQLARALATVPTSQKLVATVGLVVAVPALVGLMYGSSAKRFDPLLEQETAFTVSGVNVTTENVVVVLFGLASAIALYAFFNRSRLGRAMRGVVDDPDLLGLTGVGPARVRRMAWLIGCSFAAVSGILLASAQQQLDVTFLSLLVVQAFGAAAIGAFTNLPMAYAGGLAIGVLQAVLSKEASQHSWMQGLDINTPFLVLFVVLLVLPRRKLVELAVRCGAGPRGPPRRYGNPWPDGRWSRRPQCSRRPTGACTSPRTPSQPRRCCCSSPSCCWSGSPGRSRCARSGSPRSAAPWSGSCSRRACPGAWPCWVRR